MRGHIRPSGKGSWELVVYVGRDPETGRKRQKYRTVKGTKREAEARLASLIHSVESGLDFDARNMRVADLFEQWLEIKRTKVKPRTYRRYEELARLHVISVIGNVALAKLRPLHVERVYAVATERGLSPTTICRIHRVLFMALKRAVTWQLVPQNVAAAVEPPTESKRQVVPLEVADVDRLLTALEGTDLHVLSLVGIGTGLRLGECLGLRWKDVDLDGGALRVMQALQLDGTFSTAKSHRSARTLSIPAFTVEGLRVHRVMQNERRLVCGPAWHNLDLVFDRADGRPPRLDTTSKRFARAARDAGFNLTFHGLRHGHATLMLAAGTDLKVLSTRLGHSSVGFTLDTYTHISSKLDRQATDNFGALFAPPHP